MHMSAFGGKADMTLCGSPLLRSLLGVKRTWPIAAHMSAFDPKRTWTAHDCCRANNPESNSCAMAASKVQSLALPKYRWPPIIQFSGELYAYLHTSSKIFSRCCSCGPCGNFFDRRAAEALQVEGGQIANAAPDASGIRVFKGIPYAAPPVGELRWKAPQPVQPWNGIRSIAEWGPRCVQSSR